MKPHTRKLIWLLAVPVVLAAGAAGFIWSGTYNVAADVTHTDAVHFLLEATRERSIATRAGRLDVPSGLDDPARIVQGSGNYAAMCAGCHLAPDMPETEMSQGLYPAPPDLSKHEVDAAKAFWVIKHGIKASGMPAWGKNMGDGYIWNLAAFLQVLPTLDAAAYTELVNTSEGHSHGGGETPDHAHGDAAAEDHHAPAPQSGKVEHRHADGTVESHPAPTTP